MGADEIPPIIAGHASPGHAPPVSQWRWWIHLLALTALPVTACVLGILASHHPHRIAMVPVTVRGLLVVTVEQLGFFAVLFAIACAASRVSGRQLLLKWRGGIMPVVWGLAESVALRLLIGVLAATVVVFWMLLKAILNHGEPPALNEHPFRPQIENLVSLDALTADPVYFALMLTLVSFVLAGLREELWRAGMLAGINGLFPGLMKKRSGQAAAVLIVAVLFGLAHTPQGMGGVAMTTLLGAGLGAIMVWHRSIWEAVIAHGFFDATTFAFLYVAGKYFPHQLPGF
jgi:membrane protease YdiL (CAAX protease family)